MCLIALSRSVLTMHLADICQAVTAVPAPVASLCHEVLPSVGRQPGLAAPVPSRLHTQPTESMAMSGDDGQKDLDWLPSLHDSDSQDDDDKRAAERVRVFCRMRPQPAGPHQPSTFKTFGGGKTGEEIEFLRPPASNTPVVPGGPAPQPTKHQFRFDGCFGPDESQDAVYKKAAQGVVRSAMLGY